MIGGSGSVIALERVILTLCLDVASQLKCNALDVLGRALALPVHDQRRKRGGTGSVDAYGVSILITTRGAVGR